MSRLDWTCVRSRGAGHSATADYYWLTRSVTVCVCVHDAAMRRSEQSEGRWRVVTTTSDCQVPTLMSIEPPRRNTHHMSEPDRAHCVIKTASTDKFIQEPRRVFKLKEVLIYSFEEMTPALRCQLTRYRIYVINTENYKKKVSVWKFWYELWRLWAETAQLSTIEHSWAQWTVTASPRHT